MCGIAGIFGPEASEPDVRQMLHAIRRRGDPEHGGEVLADKGFACGTNRLAIVDPEHGRQPFVSSDGRWVCVHNGEIYNHHILRGRLESEAPFQTVCDTEILVRMWEKHNIESLDHLRGMFAFAIFDRATYDWTLVRDPLGIKPLYYVELSNGIAFASEIKALVGYDAPIKTLSPGSSLSPRGTTSYATLGGFSDIGDQAFGRDELAQALEQAVVSHLPRSHDRVAVLLSGGVDSSTVAMLADQFHPGGIEAFTIAIDGQPSEDGEAAKHLCEQLDIDLTMVSADEAHLTDFYLERGVEMTETFEPALVRNATIYHFVSRAIRAAGYKFCLSGEGADEVFGGYDYLRRVPRSERDQRILSSLREIHRTYLQMADRASMYASLEVRVPFMDYSFVRQAMRLPPDMRMTDQESKRGLRMLYPSRLPERNRVRAKQGMNPGAGFGSNDPRDGIYAAAVERLYDSNVSLRRSDGDIARTHQAAFELDLSDQEEIYNFARYFEAGFVHAELDPVRPQLNTSQTRPTAAAAVAMEKL